MGEPAASVQSVPPAAIPLPGATGAGQLTCVPSRAGQDESVAADGKQEHEIGDRWVMGYIAVVRLVLRDSLPQLLRN